MKIRHGRSAEGLALDAHQTTASGLRALRSFRLHAVQACQNPLWLERRPVYGYSVGEQDMTAFTLDGEGTGLYRWRLFAIPAIADRPVTKRALGVIAIWTSEL